MSGFIPSRPRTTVAQQVLQLFNPRKPLMSAMTMAGMFDMGTDATTAT